MLQGKTLAVASAAATNAWTQAGGRPPSWRLTFWGLLVQDRMFLMFTMPLIIPQLLWFSGAAGILTLLFDLLFLPPVVVRIVLASRLARNGIVAPGKLVKTAQAYVGRGNREFVSTYEFDHDGPQFATRLASDTPQDVLVLFDPRNPHRAMVIPEQLSTS